MKEVKSFIIALLIVVLLKVVGGILTHSYTLVMSGLLEVLLLIIGLSTIGKKNNRKRKAMLSSVYGFIMILAVISLLFAVSFIDINKVSLFVIIFILLTMVIKYMIGCYYTNLSYRKKEGILSYGNMNSNMDFIIVGIVLVSMILTKISKWVSILKYADIVGALIVGLIIIYKGIVIIKNSFKYLDEKNEEHEIEAYVKEIEKRTEVKKVSRLEINHTGGFRYIVCNISLNNGVSVMDVNTFVITLQDYLLKIGDVVKIKLVDYQKPKKNVKPKVRSKKQDARNSRSGNSKTNTKKKNTSKKNKKR